MADIIDHQLELVKRIREERIERVAAMLEPFTSEPALETLRQTLRAIYHGGTVDIVARVDGRDFRWEADWLKYLPDATDKRGPKS